ncbi:hypothetical protein Osc7112_1666 [Oscillatoria nigro-viridis PCC 7112]|uniref:DUF4126 domain-containing protein n=1 Tax=Phormidium nigroviride PCC 7112 TaxID=179408 RepID=K9VDD5_9CYAN|nr:DUF4126 domain-containing protein [Oscillatoria nigro-viridis]AFZ06163.1 hypothetical protein Osc7112_1666 [Oscillatoria nigro-viridis PCC 7112]
MVGLLAALSGSAAGGMRIALPLLLIGLLRIDKLWSEIPLLSGVPPQVAIAILVSWSLLELFASKTFVGQRVLQIVQIIFSPIVGAIMGIAIAQVSSIEETIAHPWMLWIIGIVGGLLALVLQLVQAGWFYRLRGLPIWVIFLQDVLCISLVLFAFDAPRQGGLVAMMLLWLAIRSSKEWYRWYKSQGIPGDRGNPRRRKRDPD